MICHAWTYNPGQSKAVHGTEKKMLMPKGTCKLSMTTATAREAEKRERKRRRVQKRKWAKEKKQKINQSETAT